MEPKETFDLTGNRKLKIFYDNSAESPRSWDNLAKMIFIGKYSHLGDKHDLHETQESFEAHQEYVKKELDAAYIVPVYAYIHSGMTISLSPFSCPWDSGKLGWAVLTKEQLRKEYGVKRITKSVLEKAIKILEGEIKVLDQYICGDVYGFEVVDEHDTLEDSCWGFYGDDIKENGILDHISEEDAELVKKAA